MVGAVGVFGGPAGGMIFWSLLRFNCRRQNTPCPKSERQRDERMKTEGVEEVDDRRFGELGVIRNRGKQ